MTSVGAASALPATRASSAKRKITLCEYMSLEAGRQLMPSRPFAIIVFSTVFLLLTAGGAVILLMTIGDTKLPSTLNLAIGNNMKRD